jgi:hypothetical protein
MSARATIPDGPRVDFASLPGYRWMDNGQSVFSGPMRALYAALDAMFVRWAQDCGAEDYLFPTFLPASELAKLDYFRSFPHLATFACSLDPAKENLTAFSKGAGIDAAGLDMVGATLEAPRFVTTRATCFRREEYYAPMQRQWSFGMREIVCVGTGDEVKSFLDRYQTKVNGYFEAIGLPVAWKPATDPFFNAAANPKFLAQKIDPVKTEMVYETGLAIGSVNFHRNFFGETFKIGRAGQHAFSGCVAFGVERWMFAILNHFGTDPSRWPDLGGPR